MLNLIQAADAARERAMSQDVLWYGFMSDLAVTTPKGITLNGLQVALDKPSVNTDPLVPAGLGSATFTGTAKQVPGRGRLAGRRGAHPRGRRLEPGVGDASTTATVR